MAKAKKRAMTADSEALFDIVKDGEVGQLFTYKYLQSQPPFNIEKRVVIDDGKKKLCKAVNMCNEALLEKKQSRLVNVKGVGYKIGTPEEQIIEVSRRRKRAYKQTYRGMYELAHLNKKKATAGDLANKDSLLAELYGVLGEFNKRPTLAKEEIKEIEKIAKSYCGGF